MANVLDVAAYIVEQRGRMTAMKLQKLVYYSQAWHLVWEDRPLFTQRIEAWANGPVAPTLYGVHRGQLNVEVVPGGVARNLTVTESESVDVVLGAYADLSALQLSELTHREDPWREARRGLAPGQRGTAEITPASMREYYESLMAQD